MNSLLKAAIAVLVATPFSIPLDSHAYLGGFESNDGYYEPVLPTMVNSYNAGQYGTANGGPGNSYTPASYDQPGGLWDDLNDAYGAYNIGYAGGIPYGYYVTQHPPVPEYGMFPHSGDAMLALRNTGYASVDPHLARPLDFRYLLDSRDFYNGGNPVNPSDTGDKIVAWSIWAAPGPVTAPNDGIWLSFRDAAGKIGFQFGWDESYQLRYRDEPTDGWVNTSYMFGQPWDFYTGQPVVYDRFEFSLDLLNDVWSLDVFSGLDSNTMTFVTNRPFGQHLSNFSEIDWHVGYGNEKSFFDDSGFVIRSAQIPEPGTCALLGIGGLLLWRGQRKGWLPAHAGQDEWRRGRGILWWRAEAQACS